MPCRVGNLVRKGEIACYKQFLLFSQCCPQLYIFSASKCGIVWKGVNPFQNKPWFFTFLQCRSFENTVGKGEIALNEQFLLFPSVFYPVWRTSYYFHQIKNCRLQTFSVWKSPKFVVWERV